jgi:hypothetical protein
MNSLFLWVTQRGMGNCFAAPVVAPAATAVVAPIVSTVSSGAVIVILPSLPQNPVLEDMEDDPQ